MSATAAVKIDIDSSGSLRKLKNLDRVARKLNVTFKKVQRSVKNTNREVKGMGNSFGGMAAKVAAATGAFVFFNRSLSVMSKREADVNVLSHSLQGLVEDSGKATKELTRSADKLGDMTLFSQEDFTQSFNMLTSFRTIGVDSYERVATAAADMGTKLGTDVRGNMLQLAKALEAPEVGLTALRRSGTRFTEQQTEMIKKLVKSGELLQAQEVILKEIEKQYGGAAAAAGQTFAGSVDKLNEEFRDFMEAVGKGLVPILTPLVVGLTKLLEAVSSIPEPVMQATLAIGATGLTAAVLVLSKGMVVLAAKITAVNLAVAANPWVLLAMGISAAGVAIYRAQTQFQRFLDGIKNGSTTLDEARTKLEELTKQETELKNALKGPRKGGRSEAGRRNKMQRDYAKITEQVKQLEAALAQVGKKVDPGITNGLSNVADLSEQVGQTIRSGIVDAIEGAITGAKSLGDVLSGVLRQIGRMYLNQAISTLPLPGLAEGGFVSSPTAAVIGEGGEPEYVIPDSKMDSAMARYSQGARGDAVLAGGGDDVAAGGTGGVGGGSIDVRFTSERINDVSYVTFEQFQAGVQQAASEGAKRGQQATMRTLQTSSSARRRIGV